MAPKKPLRKPDGTPEMRSVDAMLKDAVTGEEYQDLPGKGKPLDLKEYFAAGEEHRMANKILKDIGALPKHLQDRKDAETHQQAAADLLARETGVLNTLLQKIREAAVPLTACFPDRQALLERLDLETWPDCFPEPRNEPPGDLVLLIESTDELARLMTGYRARVKTLRHSYMGHLEKAQENIQSYRKQMTLSQSLIPAYSILHPIDLEARKTELQRSLPLLPAFPQNLTERLKAYLREIQPPFWKRTRS